MRSIRLDRFVNINPPVNLTRGARVNYVDMGAINPATRYVGASVQREYSGGGAKFLPGDIVFARITPCLENGKIAQYIGNTPAFGSTEFFVFRAKEGMSDPAYIYYLARSEIVRKPAEKSMVGASGRQRADLDVVRKISVSAVSLSEQKRVSSILGSYDDLITNNMRRIKILEDIVRWMYREWFVNFRFPGHKKTKFVDSPLGKIPKGWSIETLPDVVEVNPREQVGKNMTKPYVAMEGLSTNVMSVSITEMRTGTSGAKFRNGDTLLARITPCLENGKTGFVQFLRKDEIGIGSTEFIVLRSKTLCPEYVYCLARSDELRGVAIKSMSGASGRQRVDVTCFDEFDVIEPDNATLERFSGTAGAMFRQVHLLEQENANLRGTRDLLLPKLINGEIQV